MSEIATDKYRALIPCDCGSVFCTVTVWPWNEGTFSFEFGEEYVSKSLKFRIRAAWRALRNKPLSLGGVAMTQAQALELVEFLKEHAK